MIEAANDNPPPMDVAARAAMIEAIMEEFDLLCLGIPSPERIEAEIRQRTLH